jgi:hypothetical protein
MASEWGLAMMVGVPPRRSKHVARKGALLLALTLSLAPLAAHGFDEIQVYNGDIAEVGQWTIQQHLNYAFKAPSEPDFPGGIVPNHALNGTPELAYGVTDWWELGWYAPFAASNNQFLSDGAKIRTLFVTPHAADRNFFYGVNFEFDYGTPRFAQSLFNIEIRPIVGVRNKEWEFIVNPIVDVSTGTYGEADFVPAVRLARKLGGDFYIGVEYYADLGKIGNFLPLQQQQQLLFAVTDFKLGVFDVNFGVGFGLTSGSDQLISKMIISYAFPVPGAGNASDNRPSGGYMMSNPIARGRRDNALTSTSTLMQ